MSFYLHKKHLLFYVRFYLMVGRWIPLAPQSSGTLKHSSKQIKLVTSPSNSSTMELIITCKGEGMDERIREGKGDKLKGKRREEGKRQ